MGPEGTARRGLRARCTGVAAALNQVEASQVQGPYSCDKSTPLQLPQPWMRPPQPLAPAKREAG